MVRSKFAPCGEKKSLMMGLRPMDHGSISVFMSSRLFMPPGPYISYTLIRCFHFSRLSVLSCLLISGLAGFILFLRSSRFFVASRKMRPYQLRLGRPDHRRQFPFSQLLYFIYRTEFLQ